MVSGKHIAHYWSHESGEFESVTQTFDGESYEAIADSYFNIFGDRLVWLKQESDGKLVYKSDEAFNYALACVNWVEP